jgi:soluble lytic murein transglycosylase-like protein
MFLRFVVPTVAVLLAAWSAEARVWRRTRADGTVEFTSAPRSQKGWDAVPGFERRRETAPAAEEIISLPQRRRASVVWTREREDGIVEFTNLDPVGKHWKVLFRIGPGKASALRGSSDLVPARDTSPARYSRYDDHIRDQQAYYGIPQALIRAVIRTESDFDPMVVSSAGAQGLMQLMPATARGMGVTNVWDPRQNIMGGARYLQLLAKRYCHTPAMGNTQGRTASLICSLDEKVKVLAGYHAGPGAVDKYGGMPPYETTRSYVSAVLQRFEEYRKREATLSDWSESVPLSSR